MSKSRSSLIASLTFAILASGGYFFSPTKTVVAAPQPSIHEIESQQHRYINTAQTPKNKQEPTITPLNTGVRSPVSTKVLGFHPYWMGDEFYNYRFDLLTTIAFFSLEINGRGEITENNGWPNIDLINIAHQNGVKVVVVVSNFESSDLHTLLANPNNQERAIKNIIEAITSGQADGVNIDFENLGNADRYALTTFMQKLTDNVHQTFPASEVTIDIPGVDWSGSFDIENLARITDGMMIMGYDYHYKKSEQAGPVAPLQSGDIWEPYNLTKTVEKYRQAAGEQSDKILLGVPYYGYDWPTKNHELPSAALGTGAAKTYSDIRQELHKYSRKWDEHSQTPYYVYGQFHQVWYEDETSLAKKYELVQSNNLGGIGIWALGYDRGYNELWNTLESSFNTVPENGSIILAPAANGTPLIKMFTEQGRLVSSFYAYHPMIRGGYHVSHKDLDGNGQKEFITTTGVGLGPHLRIFDHKGKMLGEEFIYNKNFRGGVELAIADVLGDSRPEVITSPTSRGGPNIRVFSWSQDLQRLKLQNWFWGFTENNTSGTNLATADLNKDGKAEILVSPKEAQPMKVNIFSWNAIANQMQLINSIEPQDKNTVTPWQSITANIDGDEWIDIILFPEKKSSGTIKIFEWQNDQATFLTSLTPYNSSFAGGMNVTVGHFSNNTTDDIITAPKRGGGPNIRAFHFNTVSQTMELINWFWAYQPTFRGGVALTSNDPDGDGRDQLLTLPESQGGPNIRRYLWNDTNQQFEFQNWFWAYQPTFLGGVNFALD